MINKLEKKLVKDTQNDRLVIGVSIRHKIVNYVVIAEMAMCVVMLSICVVAMEV